MHDSSLAVASRTDAQIKSDFVGQNGQATEQDGTPLSLARVVRLNAAGEATSFQLILLLQEDLEEIEGQQRDDPQTGSWELEVPANLDIFRGPLLHFSAISALFLAGFLCR